MNYKKIVTKAFILLNKTLGEQIGEQIDGEQITVIIPNDFFFTNITGVVRILRTLNIICCLIVNQKLSRNMFINVCLQSLN